MRVSSVLLLSVWLVVVSGLLSADDGRFHTQVIQLQHQNAEAMLQVLQPHLPQNAALSQQGARLIISAEATDMDRLVQLVKALDQPLQSWKVYFARGDDDLAARQSNERRYTTRQLEVTQVQLREGEPAALDRGFWVPITSRSAAGERESGYQWLAGGVWVQARAQGEAVVLDFSARQLEAANPGARQQRDGFLSAGQQSQLLLLPGQWVTLGSESRLSSGSPATSRHFTAGQQDVYYSVCLESAEPPYCPR